MRIWVFAALMAAMAVHAQAAEPEHGFAPALAVSYLTDVQQQLTARGYYGGMIDGRMTPSLRTAISVYQSDVGLRVTGIPDLAVLNMLKFGPDIKATIQPLGQRPPAPAPRTAGVPPYEAPEPYRYPQPAQEIDDPAKPSCPTTKTEEPPLPKAAPQHRVVSSPLKAG